MIQLALRLYHVTEDIYKWCWMTISAISRWGSPLRATSETGSTWKLESLWLYHIPNPVRHGYESHLESSRRLLRPGKSRWRLLCAPFECIHGYHHNLLKWRRNTPNARVPRRLNDMVQNENQPKRFRSLSVRKGKIDATTFTVANQQIPTVSQEPVKSLRRWYDSSMKDTKRELETVELTTEGLLAISRCGLQGKLKVWCLQFMLIRKLLWSLLVYEICSTIGT